MSQTETEPKRRASLSPPAPPKRQRPEPQPEPDDTEEPDDAVTQLRAKIEAAQEALDDALALLEE
jgi:hypothetical protein